MEAYIPWMMFGVSGMALYLEKVMRTLATQLSKTPQAAAQNFPRELLVQISDQMAAKRSHLWLLFGAGVIWAFLDLL